jgi:hypothetical protein
MHFRHRSAATRLKMQRYLKCALVLGFIGNLFFPQPNGIAGQSALDDSTSQSQAAEDALLYEIEFARIQRMVGSMIKKEKKLSLPKDILDLIAEAKEYAGQGEYRIALEFLDNVLDFIQPFFEESESKAPISRTEAKTSNTNAWQWSYQIFSGADLWQQKFGIALIDHDSSIFESQGNPFVGFRVLLDYSASAKRQTQAEAEAKWSTDYRSGQLHFDHQQQLNQRTRLLAENRFEATAYYHDSDLRYVANQANLGLLFQIDSDKFLEMGDEIHLRRYEKESEYFPSFFQNQIGGKFRFEPFGLGITELSYDFRNRSHRGEPSRDYRENIFSLNLWPNLSGKASLYGRAQGRIRSYGAGYADSLFNNGFAEMYGELSMRYSLTRHFALRFEADLESRSYEHYAVSLPDYLDLMAEPSVSANVGMSLSIKLGYRFRNKHHRFSEQSAAETANIEDFYSHGPVCTVDLFAMSGFIATLSNSFEFRRFPNAPYEDGTGLSLYSNRNINSLFLFLTWNLSDHWEFNAMGNLDYDDDKDLEGSDSRTNLFNIELSYKF